MKKIVLLDLDNTIIDFNLCARHSLESIFSKVNKPFGDKEFNVFITENNKIWEKLQKGEITKPFLRDNRFKIILKKLNIQDYDPLKMEEEFEDGVKNSAYPVDNAKEFLDYLYSKYNLYIVSNGFRFIQENRLKISGFDGYFKKLFLSEDIGIQKPDTRFFDYCFEGLNSPNIEDVVLIGDSLTADIKGGNDYGIDTVWFNKENALNTTTISPTRTILNLLEIKDIL